MRLCKCILRPVLCFLTAAAATAAAATAAATAAAAAAPAAGSLQLSRCLLKRVRPRGAPPREGGGPPNVGLSFLSAASCCSSSCGVCTLRDTSTDRLVPPHSRPQTIAQLRSAALLADVQQQPQQQQKGEGEQLQQQPIATAATAASATAASAAAASAAAGESDVWKWLQHRFASTFKGQDLCLLLPRGSAEAARLSAALGGPLSLGGAPNAEKGGGPLEDGEEEAALWMARWPATSAAAAAVLQQYSFCMQQQQQYPSRPPVLFLQPAAAAETGTAAAAAVAGEIMGSAAAERRGAAAAAGGGEGEEGVGIIEGGPLGHPWTRLRCEALGAPLVWSPLLVPSTFPVRSKLQPHKLSLLYGLIMRPRLDPPPPPDAGAATAAATTAAADAASAAANAAHAAAGGREIGECNTASNAKAAADPLTAAAATTAATAAAAAALRPAAAAGASGRGGGLETRNDFSVFSPALDVSLCASTASLVHADALVAAAVGAPHPWGTPQHSGAPPGAAESLKSMERSLGLTISNPLRQKMLAEVIIRKRSSQ
ncbi:hypothetical protein Emag_006563 [Eimeria magna]